MRYCLAAAAALSLLPCRAVAAPPLTLDDAFARVSERHPDLAQLAYARESAEAVVVQAELGPSLTAGADIENALGTGSASGFDRAEITLSLASQLERGGKREARSAVANADLDATRLRAEARRLDLLAEAARRYLDVLAAQSLATIEEAHVAQRERAVQAAQHRFAAGAAPESLQLTAEAELARARLQLELTLASRQVVLRRLAILWGERAPDFQRVAGEPLALEPVPPLDTLLALVEMSPALRLFADEARLREARVQLARSALTPDVSWQVGVRQFQEEDEWATVGGFTIPLGSRKRAEPGLRSAQAELAALELERASQENDLYGTLIEAHGRLSAGVAGVIRARDDVLPRLARAEAAAERAYRAGAISYLEWAQVQEATAGTRREQLEAALEAHRALIEIQRLTGEPFLEQFGSGHPEARQ